MFLFFHGKLSSYVRRLYVLFLSLVSFFSTAIPLAITLIGPIPSSSIAEGGATCELTPAQTGAIRGLVGFFNASCNYNVSLNTLLAN
jgi:hypothetical protein